MQEFQGKTAFVTGGASGMGFAMAEAFGREGMNVMLADIEQGALRRAVQALRGLEQVRCEGVVADVSSRASMRKAALETLAKFGKVHVVVNNAGVGVSAPMERLTEDEWRWVLDVNLKGVVNGVELFVPLIDSHGEGGHIVNTASLAGLFTGPGIEPYSATKAAVVGMSEELARGAEVQAHRRLRAVPGAGEDQHPRQAMATGPTPTMAVPGRWARNGAPSCSR